MDDRASKWCLALSVLLMGCSSLNPLPNRSALQAMDRADRMVVDGHEISDREVIEGLRAIYRKAKWRPFIDTEPADQITFKIYDGDTKMCEFRYGAGWLIEGSRKGILSSEQQDWISENVRSRIPERQVVYGGIL